MEDELEEESPSREKEWQSETVGEHWDLQTPKEKRYWHEFWRQRGIPPQLGGPNASMEVYASKLHRRRWWNFTPNRERRFRSGKLTRKALIQEMLAEYESRPGKRKTPKPPKPTPELPPLPVKKGASSIVFDVKGDREIHMKLPAREAIIAAYAQFRKKDFDHTGYEKRYGKLAKPIDRSGKWDLPPGFALEDFVAYDADQIQKARDKSRTQKLPQGTIRTRPPRVVAPPTGKMPPPERAAKPKPLKRGRHVTANELLRPPVVDDVLAGPLSRLQATVEDVIRGAGRKRR